RHRDGNAGRGRLGLERGCQPCRLAANQEWGCRRPLRPAAEDDRDIGYEDVVYVPDPAAVRVTERALQEAISEHLVALGVEANYVHVAVEGPAGQDVTGYINALEGAAV